MMKAATKMILALSLSGALFSGIANAANWQDQLSSAANALGQNANGSGTSATGTQGGASLASLAGLLNGGNKSLSANSMSNAAGVLQYCMKNNIVDNNVSSVKDQLLGKLGLADSLKQKQSTDYNQGLMGLLNTGNNQQVNLKSLGDSEMGKKVKTKACDLVLKQGQKFIS
ncbi:Putative glycoprotein/receptor YjjA [Erwinia tasmaniensis Et1/99]|uniref:Glycoprotein/receptor YjjA n=2 Tax=Erwinia tasmaniensis TaxID=338565 RepID=B2VGN2_ERWT9|nr:Putative glycoprotein/receptor YjjA [Erwinia tasmaniensis Et1/99]